jgi:hypothetical protein
VLTAASSVPATISPSVAVSTRRRPCRSPSRPAIGVAIAAVSRNAVMTHADAVADACSVRWMWGTAGVTLDCSSA